MDEIDEIVDLLIELTEATALEADSMSDEEFDEFLEFMAMVISEIEELEELPEAPAVPPGEFPSSNVNGFKYDPKNQKLWIQFHGKYPQAEGSVYSYDKVPPWVYNLLKRGAVGPATSGKNRFHQWHKGVLPSYGAVVHWVIKQAGYPYKKVA